MSGWNGDEANYKTTCPYCSSQLVASITITTTESLPSSLASASVVSKLFASPPSAKDSSLSPAPSPSASPMPSGETDGMAEYSGKTWPRSKSTIAEMLPSADSASSGSVHLHSGSPKSEGTPTRYEKVGEGRSGMEMASAHSSNQSISGTTLNSSHASRTSPTHNSSSDPLQRREKTLPSKSALEVASSSRDMEGPQFCFRLPVSISSTESRESELMMSSVQSVKSRRQTGTGEASRNRVMHHGANATQPQTMTPQAERNGIISVMDSKDVEIKSKSVSALKPPGVEGDGDKNHPDSGPGQGVMASYIAKMRKLGHRRASSAPIKRPSTTSTEPRQDDVFISNEAEMVAKENRTRKMPCCVTETHPPFVVPYLSPMVLRKEVESLISQGGTRLLETEDLVRERPIIYWNLVWYFSRLHLPTYLPLLNLWDFQKKNQALKKVSVRMQVELLWDCRFPGVREPLYLLWLGRVPRPLHLSKLGIHKRRDSESQLQSLVARVQCGDWPPLLNSLLRDRVKEAGPEAVKEELSPRSIYRETLFLNMIVSTSLLEIDQFDREYQQHIQRLPKDLSGKLHPQDYPPSQRSIQCRRVFGLLQVK